MNKNTLKGKWKQLKGAARARWGQVTGNHLTRLHGRIDMFTGRAQELWGRFTASLRDKLDALGQRLREPDRSDAPRG